MLSTKQFNQFQSTYKSAYEYTHSFKLFMWFIRSITVDLISFCEMCFICIKFYLKKGEGHGIHSRFFFNPLILYIFPIFFIYSLWISFPFKYIKSIVKSWQKGGMLESNCWTEQQTQLLLFLYVLIRSTQRKIDNL